MKKEKVLKQITFFIIPYMVPQKLTALQNGRKRTVGEIRITEST